MKKLLVFFIILIGALSVNAQITSSIQLRDSTSNGKPVYMTQKVGSCASTDGPVNSTIVSPPNYAWLQANGYCNPGAYGGNPTTCWTFTPSSTSITINSGFSHDCANVSFSNFNLYDNTCGLVGAGFNFNGLTIGDSYTWCFSGNSWNTFFDVFFNGPCTGFLDFCPYYFNNSTLPIELLEFDGYSDEKVNKIYWTTASEINNDYFSLERSEDGIHWEEIKRIKGIGNSNSSVFYEYIDDSPFIMISYYRLSQVDFDGVSETFNVIAVENESSVFYVYSKSGDNNIYLSSPYEYKLYNMMGQVVRSGGGDAINTVGLTKGVYILRVGVYTKKFFIR